METLHIRFIRAVAEHGNISAASREVGMTQPALTKIVSRVENLVGARLFDRGPRGVALTPFGQTFMRRMDRVEREMLNLDTEIRALKTGSSGTVNLGVGQFWIGRIVPQLVARLIEQEPDVHVTVATAPRHELMESLRRGRIDLMLGRITDDLPEDLAGEALSDVRLCLTVRDGHPLTKLKRPIEPADLEPYKWVLPPRADPTAAWLTGTLRQQYLPSQPIAVEAVSHSMTVGLLLASDMLTVLPEVMNNQLAGGLARLDAPWLLWSRKAGVISVRDRPLLPCCLTFLDMMRAEMRGAAS